jgi:hypothetical protein
MITVKQASFVLFSFSFIYFFFPLSACLACNYSFCHYHSLLIIILFQSCLSCPFSFHSFFSIWYVLGPKALTGNFSLLELFYYGDEAYPTFSLSPVLRHTWPTYCLYYYCLLVAQITLKNIQLGNHGHIVHN